MERDSYLFSNQRSKRAVTQQGYNTTLSISRVNEGNKKSLNLEIRKTNYSKLS